MNQEPIQLDSYFPYFLGTISNRWTSRSSRIYLERFGIGVAEWRVLASIQALRTASSQDVVSLISMDAGAVSRAVKQLESVHYVQSVQGRFPGRTKPYRLTPSGGELYGKIAVLVVERENILLADLTAEERADLYRIMRKIMPRLADL